MYRFGLIGHPVSQSKSPQIHQRFLNEIQEEGSYNLYDVEENQLANQLNEFKTMGVDGFNVTVPYKEKVISLLDDLDYTAEQLKSVNTVKREGNHFIGYNTDGLGYIESLRQDYPLFLNNISSKSVLILGAGGAARGIYYSIQDLNPKQVDIANRTITKVEDIIRGFNNSEMLTLAEAENRLFMYDLIIQTTTVGMTPDEDKQIISLKNLKQESIVSDIVYKPKWTNFLKEAEIKGAALLFGETMLWYQAAKSFEIWTGYSVGGIGNINSFGRS